MQITHHIYSPCSRQTLGDTRVCLVLSFRPSPGRVCSLNPWCECVLDNDQHNPDYSWTLWNCSQCRSAGNVTNTQSPLSQNNEICRENRRGAKQEDPLTKQQNQRCVKKQYKVQKYCIQETCTLWDKGSNCVDLPLCCVSVRRVENKNQHTTTTLIIFDKYTLATGIIQISLWILL